jgi:hypothetical protein
VALLPTAAPALEALVGRLVIRLAKEGIVREIKEFKDVELFVTWNEHGNVVADTDKDTAVSVLIESNGDTNVVWGAKFKFSIPIPEGVPIQEVDVGRLEDVEQLFPQVQVARG